MSHPVSVIFTCRRGPDNGPGGGGGPRRRMGGFRGGGGKFYDTTMSEKHYELNIRFLSKNV